MSTFTKTIFKDIFIKEMSTKEFEKNIISILNNIDNLFNNTYKNEKLLKEAVLDFGDFLYLNFSNLSVIFNKTDIMQYYMKIVIKEQEQFTLILETLNKKEKIQVYELLDVIMKIKYPLSLNFMLDNIPREIYVPVNFSNDEEKERIKKMIASYITLLLRKEKCVLSILIDNNPYKTLIGVLINDKKWFPIKKDYMRGMHMTRIKEVGEKLPLNFKYAEIKKSLK